MPAHFDYYRPGGGGGGGGSSYGSARPSPRPVLAAADADRGLSNDDGTAVRDALAAVDITESTTRCVVEGDINTTERYYISITL